MLAVINTYSTFIGSILILFGLIILGLIWWERRQSETISVEGKRVKRDDLKNLQDNMVSTFNPNELEEFCFNNASILDVKYENLKGDRHIDKTRELILHCERRGKRDELIEACRIERPHVKSWVESPPSEASTEKSLSRPTISQPTLIAYGLSGIVPIGIGIFLLLSSPPPSVALLSISFELGNYNPRISPTVSEKVTEGIDKA